MAALCKQSGFPSGFLWGFFGLVFQNNVADVGSTSGHMCMAQAPFQRGLGVGAGRVVWVRTEEAKQGLPHIFNFLSFLVSTVTVPVLLSGNMVLLPRCDHISAVV